MSKEKLVLKKKTARKNKKESNIEPTEVLEAI